jgi:hypothetical protein
LGELAAKIGATSLPPTGALAFFAGASGAVVYIPQSADRRPTDPPRDTPELIESGGSPDWRADLLQRLLYPFWPLDFTALELPPSPAEDGAEDYTAPQVAAVERHFKRRQYGLSANLAFAGPPIPDWWQTAIHFADELGRDLRRVPETLQKEQKMLDWAREQVKEARSKGEAELKKAEGFVAMYEASLATMRGLQPAFQNFVTEVASWAAGREPWALMSPEDMARLAAYWARNPQFRPFSHYWGAVPVDVLKERMFKALPTSDAPAFGALPVAVQTLINAKRAPRPIWWHSALHFASQLEQAAKAGAPPAAKFTRDRLEADRQKLARLTPGGPLGTLGRTFGRKSDERSEVEKRIATSEAKLAELDGLEPAFQKFAQETFAWAQGHDPWSFMAPAEIAELNGRLKRAAEEFPDFTRKKRLEDLEHVTLRTLASADNRGYATLPEPVRELINREYLLPPGAWHQMLGRGVEIQGDSAAKREEGYVLLLQLTHDDMMFWDFGDNGAYQFWISPADLAQRNWSAVEMTFECH